MWSDSSAPWRVAINAHLISGRAGYRSAGVHQYIKHLLAYLPAALPDSEVIGLMGGEGASAIRGISVVKSRLPTQWSAVRIAWEQIVQPVVVQRINASVVHGPVNVVPLLGRCPKVVTIHDLSFVRYPHMLRLANRVYLSVMAKLSARRAQRIIAVSRFTASESEVLFGIPKDRIQVVYHGVDPSFRPLPTPQVESFRARRGLPKGYMLFVGTLEPRKNLVRLVEAYARLGNSAPPLLLVGGKGWLYDDLLARITSLGLADRVHLVGYVPQEELPLWYNAALVFAYPSLYEGFGLPVLEAQACGVPVLTSATTSLPEAAGDAAVLVDPRDVDALQTALQMLLCDSALRQELREQGLAHSAEFSWQQAASQTAAAYRAAMAAR